MNIIVMTSVLNIEPDNIIIKELNEGVIYNFLDSLKKDYKMDINKYYDILNTSNIFKLKNVYQFLYLRIHKMIRKGYTIDPLSKINKKISGEELNQYLHEYINQKDGENQLINSIIIMNGIQLYFYPHINLS
tara:strand:- start:1502 stop:1897 length:396 start_codon:yes stop_codon:yes gene_type:complete